MHIDVSLQLAQLGASALLGFALGAVYDILRIIRRRLATNVLPDIIFCLLTLAALFTLGMDIGAGALHIFMLCAVVIGFCLYMLLLSAAVLFALDAFADLLGRIFAPVKKLIKIISKFSRKCFSRSGYRVTMIFKKFERRKTGKNEKIDDDSRSGIDDAGHICYSEPCKHKSSGA